MAKASVTVKKKTNKNGASKGTRVKVKK